MTWLIALGWGRSLLSAFGLQIAIAVGAIALLAGVYLAGVHAERSRGQAAALRVELNTARLDASIAQTVAEKASAQAASLEAQNRSNEDAIEVLQKSVAARPAVDQCLATQSDVDGLSHVR